MSPRLLLGSFRSYYFPPFFFFFFCPASKSTGSFWLEMMISLQYGINLRSSSGGMELDSFFFATLTGPVVSFLLLLSSGLMGFASSNALGVASPFFEINWLKNNQNSRERDKFEAYMFLKLSSPTCLKRAISWRLIYLALLDEYQSARLLFLYFLCS